MMDKMTTYHSSKNKREPKTPGRSSARFMLAALATLIFIGLFSGCTSNRERLVNIRRNILEARAIALEDTLIEYEDPKRDSKHKRRMKRALRKEKRRLKAFAEQKEREEELLAEQWWIEKELLALELADERKKMDTDEVKSWKKEEGDAEPKIEPGPKSFEQRVLSSLGMVYVKGGCFEVSERTNANIDGEKVDIRECVDDFYVGKHEITIGEFLEFTKETRYVTDAERDGGCYLYTGNTWYKTETWKKKNVYNWRDISFNQDIDHPVACVSWHDANEFAQWKSSKHGIKYRLPTEAEWEYAASGGEHREKWSGTNEKKDVGIYAWHFNNSNNRTHPVGQRKPNKLGLFDMSGNVWEWVQDNYDYSEGSMADSDTTLRVIRGGSWNSIHSNLSTAKRFKHLQPSYRDFASGFRLGMDGRIRLNKVSSAR